MRVKRGVKGRRKRKEVLKAAKGFRGGRSKLIRSAYSSVDRALRFSYRDRRVRKRNFRALWITRIGIAAEESQVSYSRLMGGLKKKNIQLDRKILADLAVSHPKDFDSLVAFATQ